MVEDDQVDAITVRRAFQYIGATDQIIHVAHGEAALAFLNSELNTKPDLILLDLNMPRMNGIEFLHALKYNPCLSKIPVIVLTTSKDHQDIMSSFSSSVAGYMTKSMEFDRFTQKIKSFADYWTLSRLPGEASEVLA